MARSATYRHKHRGLSSRLGRTYNIEGIEAKQETTHALRRDLGDPSLARRHEDAAAQTDDDLSEQEHAAPDIGLVWIGGRVADGGASETQDTSEEEVGTTAEPILEPSCRDGAKGRAGLDQSVPKGEPEGWDDESSSGDGFAVVPSYRMSARSLTGWRRTYRKIDSAVTAPMTTIS